MDITMSATFVTAVIANHIVAIIIIPPYEDTWEALRRHYIRYIESG